MNRYLHTLGQGPLGETMRGNPPKRFPAILVIAIGISLYVFGSITLALRISIIWFNGNHDDRILFTLCILFPVLVWGVATLARRIQIVATDNLLRNMFRGILGD